MATHSSVLAWRIPGMGEPSGLLSVGSHRVEHDRSDLAAVAVLYIPDINSLSDILFSNIFFHFMYYLFTLLIASFDTRSFQF